VSRITGDVSHSWRGLSKHLGNGLVYRAVGFPVNVFTVLFSIGRLPGWIAQWQELKSDPHGKIGRPRQVYSGEPLREFVPIDQRD
jgi:citrate synthase